MKEYTVAFLFLMIYTEILLRDNYAIQRNNMLLLVVTAQQCYNGRSYANYFNYFGTSWNWLLFWLGGHLGFCIYCGYVILIGFSIHLDIGNHISATLDLAILLNLTATFKLASTLN